MTFCFCRHVLIAAAASTPPSSPSSNIYYRRNANYLPASLPLSPRLHGLSLDAFSRQPQTLQAMKRSIFGKGRASSSSSLASSNIPNKYSQKLLLNMLDNHCIHCNEQVAEGEEEDEPLSALKGYRSFVYTAPKEGLAGMKDSFDVSLEGVLRRFQEQRRT